MVRSCCEEGPIVQLQRLPMRMLQNLELAIFQTLRGKQMSLGPEPGFPGSWISSLKQQGCPQHGCPGSPCLDCPQSLQETPRTGGANGYRDKAGTKGQCPRAPHTTYTSEGVKGAFLVDKAQRQPSLKQAKDRACEVVYVGPRLVVSDFGL